MSNELDKLLLEVQAEKDARARENEELRRELSVDSKTREQLLEERRAKVAGFRLDLDLPDDEPPVSAASEEPAETGMAEAPAPELVEESLPVVKSTAGFLLEEEESEESEKPTKPVKKASKKKKKKKNSAAVTAAKAIFYIIFVLGVSGVLTYFGIVGIIDLLGLNKSSQTISVSIPIGSTTKDIASILHENGVIDQPVIFRLYSRLTGADGGYQPHDQLELSPDMGYGDLIDALSAEQKREEVTITIPEGFTLMEIAALLEEKKVCSQEEFERALVTGDYSEYDFLQSQPTEKTDKKYANRVYDLEGYLFPDTYNFFTHSSAYSAICKMLDNFDVRLSTDMRTALKAKDMTIDEAVILASIIQGEAANSVDMAKVSRVLYNRLKDTDEFPKLQCDSTTDYIIEVLGTNDETAVRKAYDTYICEGLPVGAICNPGLDALNAVLSPTADKDIQKCYYFATDYDTGITYYSRTYSQHEKVCKKYGIGMYG